MLSKWRPKSFACPLLPVSGTNFMSMRDNAGWPVPSRVAEVARLRLWEYEGGALASVG
jgi:hypothetical protein